jgi:SNF2 family DNA or RNA helicase
MMRKQLEDLTIAGEITEEEKEEAQMMMQSLRGASMGAMMFNRQIGSDVKNAETSESVAAALLEEKGLIEPAIQGGGTKRQGVSDYVKGRVEKGKAAIVFTEFLPSMEVLKEEFESKGLTVGMIHGGMGSAERTANQRAFQGIPCEEHFRRPGAVKECEHCTQPTVDVIICTRAANKGLNLQRGATQVHYDMSWVPSDFSQRVGRSRRFGSDEEEIEVTIAMMKGTMEERVGALLVPRAMQALMALDGARDVDLSGSSLSGMSKEMANNLSAEFTDATGHSSIFAMAKELVLNGDDD